jgi:diacylglycerol O-acyltransferase
MELHTSPRTTTRPSRARLIHHRSLVDLTQFSTPVLATAAVRLVSRLRLANRVAQPFNLVISNVPGPRQPLYFAGAQLCHQFPVSIVTDGQGLNITVTSYLDRLDFGFIADRDLIPDLWDLADMHIAEIGRLFDATGAEWAQPPQPAAPRRGPITLAQTGAKPPANKSTSTTDSGAQP